MHIYALNLSLKASQARGGEAVIAMSAANKVTHRQAINGDIGIAASLNITMHCCYTTDDMNACLPHSIEDHATFY